MESAPRNVQVRPLSATMMMITWEPPETPNGQVTVSVSHALAILRRPPCEHDNSILRDTQCLDFQSGTDGW